jgi:hypothetical protein
MSALLNASPKNASGVIVLDGQLTATLDYSNGLPYEGGSLAIDTIGSISYYNMGLPYTAVHRIATTVSAPTFYGGGAAPFDAAGRFCIAAGATTNYSSGVPYIATGQVALG